MILSFSPVFSNTPKIVTKELLKEDLTMVEPWFVHLVAKEFEKDKIISEEELLEINERFGL